MLSCLLSQCRSLLCLGAHADDIEIGCGGLILDAIARQPELQVTWVVWSGDNERQQEAVRSAHSFLGGSAQHQVHMESFPDAFFPAQWEPIKRRFSALARTCRPDLVLTHRLEDRHQDHRVLAELTWNTFRDQLILEYEIPKYEGDLGQPNVYFPLSDEVAARKIELLETHFGTQRSKDWFDARTFQALHRLRGLESRAASGWAEAFYVRKLVLSFS